MTPYTAVLSRVGVVERVRLVEVFAVLGQDFRKDDVSLKPGGDSLLKGIVSRGKYFEKIMKI